MKNIQSTITLNNGVQIPRFGLGVFMASDGEEVENAVDIALKAGYRLIDTAAIYGNERGVGKAIKNSGLPRKDIFITTKLWNSDQGYDSTLRAFEKSLSRLDTDYVDLYLIHWPVKGKYLQTWKAFEKLYEQKLVRAIGVSNFLVHHLKNLLSACHIPPTVDQIEFHPYLQQPSLIEYCFENKIIPEAWRPIVKGKVNDDPVLIQIAQKYHKSPVQLVLRWEIQKGLITIPKSVHEDRIKHNADIFDFEIDETDMKKIDALDKNKRFGPDPDNFNF